MKALLATPLLPVTLRTVTAGQPGSGERFRLRFPREDGSKEQKSGKTEQQQETAPPPSTPPSAIDVILSFRAVSHGDPVLRLALEEEHSFSAVVGIVPVPASVLPFLPSPVEFLDLAASTRINKDREQVQANGNGHVEDVGAPPQLLDVAALCKAFVSRRMRPVFVDAAAHHQATAGFAQCVLNPVFHSRPFSSDYIIAAHIAGTASGSDVSPQLSSGPFSRGPDSREAGEPLTPSSILTLEERFLQAYRDVNSAVAAAVAAYSTEDEAICIHGHEQLLLATYLRPLLKKGQTVALFNHLPFPTSELYRILPARYELLAKGMLGADIVGFNSLDYTRHFLSSCVRIAGLETTAKGVHVEGRFVHTHASPVGIDPRRIEAILAKPDVRARINDLRAQFAGKRVIVGVDELDVRKGVQQKLLAFEHLLKTKAEFKDNTVLIQLSTAPPPQAEVLQAATEKLQWSILDAVGRICGAFGQLTSPAGAATISAGPGTGPGHRFRRLSGGPVFYFVPSEADEEDLVCLFAIADLYLDTSLRDSLHLVPLEYIATRSILSKLLMNEAAAATSTSPPPPSTSSSSTLNAAVIVSEFAGVAQVLKGAFMINPNDLPGMVDTIATALTPDQSQEHDRRHHQHQHHHHRHHADPLFTERHQQMLAVVEKHTVQAWRASLFRKIAKVKEDLEFRASLSSLSPLPLMQKRGPTATAATRAVIDRFRSANHRVLFIDAEGVLMRAEPESSSATAAASASLPTLNEKAVAALRLLSSSVTQIGAKTTTVVILSRKSRETMELLFDDDALPCPFVLVAENGSFIRWAPETSWECELPDFHPSSQRLTRLEAPLLHQQPAWFQDVLPIFHYFAERTPGSTLEMKEASITFHYGGALTGHTNKFALYQARDLASTLAEFTTCLPVTVVTSAVDRHVTVRMPHANKALVVYNLLRRLNCYREINTGGEHQVEEEEQEMVLPRFHLRRDLRTLLPGKGRQPSRPVAPVAGTSLPHSHHVITVSQEYQSLPASLWHPHKSPDATSSSATAGGVARKASASSSSSFGSFASAKSVGGDVGSGMTAGQRGKAEIVSSVTAMLQRLFPKARVDFVLALISPSDPKDDDVFGVLQRMQADVLPTTQPSPPPQLPPPPPSASTDPVAESGKQVEETAKGTNAAASNDGPSPPPPAGATVDPTVHLGALGTLGGSASPVPGIWAPATVNINTATAAVPLPLSANPVPATAAAVTTSARPPHQTPDDDDDAAARRREKKVLGLGLHSLLSSSLSPRPFRSPRAVRFLPSTQAKAATTMTTAASTTAAAVPPVAPSISTQGQATKSSPLVAHLRSFSSVSSTSSSSGSRSASSLPSAPIVKQGEETSSSFAIGAASQSSEEEKEEAAASHGAHHHQQQQQQQYHGRRRGSSVGGGSGGGGDELSEATIKGLSIPAPRPLKAYAASRKASNKSLGSLAGLAESISPPADGADAAVHSGGGDDDDDKKADSYPPRSSSPLPLAMGGVGTRGVGVGVGGRVMSSVALDTFELGLSTGGINNSSSAGAPSSSSSSAGAVTGTGRPSVYRERGRSGAEENLDECFTKALNADSEFAAPSATTSLDNQHHAVTASLVTIDEENAMTADVGTGGTGGDSSSQDSFLLAEAESRLTSGTNSSSPSSSSVVFVDCAVSRKQEMRKNARWSLEDRASAAAFLELLAGQEQAQAAAAAAEGTGRA